MAWTPASREKYREMHPMQGSGMGSGIPVKPSIPQGISPQKAPRGVIKPMDLARALRGK